MNKKIIPIGAAIVGILLLIIAYVYFTTPAEALPHFMPGFSAGSTHVHLKHAVASLLLGLAAFALAWFQSGKKSAQPQI